MLPIDASGSEKTLYYVRHGQSQWAEHMIGKGNLDLPLSYIGVNQASTAAIFLNGLADKNSRLFCSPLIRTKQTCEIICKERGCTPKFDSRLIEKSFDINFTESEENFYRRISDFAKDEVENTDVIIAHGLVFEKLQAILKIHNIQKISMGGIAKFKRDFKGVWSLEIIHSN